MVHCAHSRKNKNLDRLSSVYQAYLMQSQGPEELHIWLRHSRIGQPTFVHKW